MSTDTCIPLQADAAVVCGKAPDCRFAAAALSHLHAHLEAAQVDARQRACAGAGASQVVDGVRREADAAFTLCLCSLRFPLMAMVQACTPRIKRTP